MDKREPGWLDSLEMPSLQGTAEGITVPPRHPQGSAPECHAGSVGPSLLSQESSVQIEPAEFSWYLSPPACVGCSD